MEVQCFGLADTKAASQKWLQHHWRGTAEHIWADNGCLVAGEGRCLLHNRSCIVPTVRPDLATAGLPCPAFSRSRTKNGCTLGTGPASSHPSFHTVMSEWEHYLTSRNPLGFWVEEVEEFSSTGPPTVRGKNMSFMEQFARQACRHGYAIRVLRLNHSVWSEMPRGRVFIIGMGKEVGHSRGADWVVQAVEESQRYRQLALPTRVWDMLDPYDDMDCAESKDQRCALIYTVLPPS